MAKKSVPLTVQGISKSFKSKGVLDNITFDVEPGEIFGLIGLNGVGKTTLIKIILDLLRQDNGDVKFFGKDVALPESRKDICYLPEKFHPSSFLKGKEFLSLSLSYSGKSFDIKEAQKKAEFISLDPKALDQKIGNYSKGMAQKLGLLSVFLTKTPLVILDEPMSGLDPTARIQLKDQLSDYAKQGNTVFFSSHILSDIEEICGRIAVLHNQKFVFLGKPNDFMKEFKEKTLERAFLKAIA